MMNLFKLRKQKRFGSTLVNGSLSISLALSVLIILGVQMCSLFLLIFLTQRDINRQSRVTADEIAIILQEPLYNVEDAQTARIAEALVSSGRISGITIYSTATGVVFEKRTGYSSRWVSPQSRRIEFRDIYLGDVTIEYSDDDFIRMLRVFFYATLALIITVVLSNIFIIFYILRKRVKRVFGTIEVGIHAIRAGDYKYHIPESGYEDMDVIIDLLNDMSINIREKKDQLLELNAGLEVRVAERTSDLEAALAEQRLLQERLVEAGKLSVVGQLSAGIAHEFNTPLGAIISSNESLIDYLDESFLRQPEFFMGLTRAEQDLYLTSLHMGFEENRTLNLPVYTRGQRRDAAEFLSKTGVNDAEAIVEILADMCLLEKMEGILPLLQTNRSLEILEAVSGAVSTRRMTEIINESGKKASTVVSALRSYLMSDTNKTRVVDINEALKRVLTLMHNMLKHGVDIHTELSPAKVVCSADELDQVLLNIIRNAAQAMDFKGLLTLQTGSQNGTAWISVVDSGTGIPEELQEKIFEPFFTTRQYGAGMGLGLDICKRIIEKNNGTLSFNSRPGRTEFIITLPAQKEDVE